MGGAAWTAWGDNGVGLPRLGFSFGISFVCDEIGYSMLVRRSGSTPSSDHSGDGISIGISLDHTLIMSFWYIFLVEPSRAKFARRLSSFSY